MYNMEDFGHACSKSKQLKPARHDKAVHMGRRYEADKFKRETIPMLLREARPHSSYYTLAKNVLCGVFLLLLPVALGSYTLLSLV